MVANLEKINLLSPLVRSRMPNESLERVQEMTQELTALGFDESQVGHFFDISKHHNRKHRVLLKWVKNRGLSLPRVQICLSIISEFPHWESVALVNEVLDSVGYHDPDISSLIRNKENELEAYEITDLDMLQAHDYKYLFEAFEEVLDAINQLTENQPPIPGMRCRPNFPAHTLVHRIQKKLDGDFERASFLASQDPERFAHFLLDRPLPYDLEEKITDEYNEN